MGGHRTDMASASIVTISGQRGGVFSTILTGVSSRNMHYVVVEHGKVL